MCAKKTKCITAEVDLDAPRYDMDSFFGRYWHYYSLCHPRNILVTDKKLGRACDFIMKYRTEQPLPCWVKERHLWRAKNLYEATFDETTGEKLNWLSRMAAKPLTYALLLGGMMTFYEALPHFLLWQWLNQTYNMYMVKGKRGDKIKVTNKQLAASYILGSGIASSIVFSRMFRCACGVKQRMMPFLSLCLATCVTVPLIRAQELRNGIPILDCSNQKIGNSKHAAHTAAIQDIISKIVMIAPGMLATPFLMNHMERRGTFCRYPWSPIPMQIGSLGAIFLFSIPLGYALFKPCCEMRYKLLESNLKEKLNKKYNNCPPRYVYFQRVQYF